MNDNQDDFQKVLRTISTALDSLVDQDEPIENIVVLRALGAVGGTIIGSKVPESAGPVDGEAMEAIRQGFAMYAYGIRLCHAELRATETIGNS